jgi:hypothetical protein
LVLSDTVEPDCEDSEEEKEAFGASEAEARRSEEDFVMARGGKAGRDSWDE